MRTDITFGFFPADDGGATLRLNTSQVDLSLPLDHELALKAAASILLCAGVTRAEYEDGRLRELA